jgi:hypothetical protein
MLFFVYKHTKNIQIYKYTHYKQVFLLIDGHHGVVGPDNYIPVHIPGELNVIHIPAGNDPNNLIKVKRNGVQGLDNRVFRGTRHNTAVGLYSGRHVAVVKLVLI